MKLKKLNRKKLAKGAGEASATALRLAKDSAEASKVAAVDSAKSKNGQKIIVYGVTFIVSTILSMVFVTKDQNLSFFWDLLLGTIGSYLVGSPFFKKRKEIEKFSKDDLFDWQRVKLKEGTLHVSDLTQEQKIKFYK